MTRPSHLGDHTAEPAGPSAGPGLVRVSVGLFVASTTCYLALFGVLNLLLPAQVVGIVGESAKEATFGLISTLGAVVAMIASPLLGAWSDRTGSRFGRRNPWILAGSIGGVVALNLIGVGQEILVIALGWCAAQLCYNATITGFSTVLPERVPLHRRGLVSGLVGAGSAIGLAAAPALVAPLVLRPAGGTLLLSLIALVGAIAYCVIAPERRSAAPVPPRGSVLRSLVFNPRTSPNFSWAWLGRATIVLGYYLVGARLLYFVQDRLGIGVVAAAAAVGSLALIGGVAKIVALLASGPLSDRWGRRPFVAGAAVVVALGLLSLTVATDVTTLTICYFVLALGFGVFVGVDQALVADVLPARSDVAKDLGIINLAATLPQTLAPAIGSLLLAAFGGSYNALLIVGAVIAATSAVATYRIKGVR